jgi:hypothetical protein
MNVFSFSKIDACQSKNLTDTGVNIKNNEVRGGGRTRGTLDWRLVF